MSYFLGWHHLIGFIVFSQSPFESYAQDNKNRTAMQNPCECVKGVFKAARGTTVSYSFLVLGREQCWPDGGIEKQSILNVVFIVLYQRVCFMPYPIDQPWFQGRGPTHQMRLCQTWIVYAQRHYAPKQYLFTQGNKLGLSRRSKVPVLSHVKVSLLSLLMLVQPHCFLLHITVQYCFDYSY